MFWFHLVKLSMIDKIIKWEDLITVTVTFHPDFSLLWSQLNSLPEECLKILIDNTSCVDIQRELRTLYLTIANTHIVINEANIGLAAALNQGVFLAQCMRPSARFCLLLDQDSEPEPGSVTALILGFEELHSQGKSVACVGPLLIDATTGLSHGFHQATFWRWRRVYPPAGSAEPVRCANLNGSGTLVPINLFLQLGGLDESLFIDHVDTEWSFRVQAQGYTLWGIPRSIFKHRMGQGSLRYWFFGWYIWPSRLPSRHRYLFCNALKLIRRPYVLKVWKLWAIIKLSLTFILHALFDSQRFFQLQSMIQGMRDGLKISKTIDQKL